MDYSTPGLPVHHQLLEVTQTHVHIAADHRLETVGLSACRVQAQWWREDSVAQSHVGIWKGDSRCKGPEVGVAWHVRETGGGWSRWRGEWEEECA